MVKNELANKLVDLCGEYGFLSEYSHELIDSLIETIVEEEDI